MLRSRLFSYGRQGAVVALFMLGFELPATAQDDLTNPVINLYGDRATAHVVWTGVINEGVGTPDRFDEAYVPRGNPLQ